MTPRQWLQQLGGRCAPTLLSATEADAKVRDFVEGLKNMPKEAFTEDSLQAASETFDYFPPFAALHKFLIKWWEDNRPRPPALPGADDPNLDTEDRIWIKLWNEKQAAGFSDGPNAMERLRLVRRFKPRAYAFLLRTDDQAAQIAVLNKWHDEPRGDRTPEEIAAAARTVSAAMADLAAVTVRKLRAGSLYRAPDPAHLATARATAADATDTRMAAAIEEERAQRAAAFEAKHGRKPGELTAEQLAAQRADNPLFQKATAYQREQMKAGTQPDPLAESPPESPPTPEPTPEPEQQGDNDAPWVPSWDAPKAAE
jgi:hypothetical protein